MLFQDGKQTFKTKLANIDNNEEHIITLQWKVTEDHKEIIAQHNKLRPVLEGIEKNKRLKSLYGFKCDFYQDVMFTIYFIPSPLYLHLRVTVISDGVWCWDLE